MFCLAAALAVVAAQPLIKAEYDLLMDLYAVTGASFLPTTEQKLKDFFFFFFP